MNKDLHNIDDLFRNSIDGHAEEVPPDVWKNIDHSLDKKQAAFYKRKYFAVRAAAILVILIGGVTIAAILHFNQREKISQGEPSNGNIVTTSKGRGQNVKEEKAPQLEKQKSVSDQNETVTDQNVVLKKQEGNIVDETNTVANSSKASTKKYGAVTNDNYSAEKNEAMPVAKSKNEIVQQNEIVKYKSIKKTAVDLVVNRQNKLEEKVIEQKTKPLAENEARETERTIHVDRNLLSIDKTGITASLPVDWLNRLPIDFVSVSTVPGNIKVQNRFKSWSISPAYAQNMNLNTLKDDEQFRNPRSNSVEAKRTEQEAKSFTVGLGVQRQINRNMFLQSGIQYFSSTTDIEPKTIFAEPDARGDVRFHFSCSSGESYLPTKMGAPPTRGDSIKTNVSQSEISYLQVPLLLAYQINFGKVSLVPSAGIQTNFLLRGELNSFLQHPTTKEEVSGSIDGLRRTYFSGIIQPQLEYKMNDRISFDFNPNINFSLSPINKETAIKTYQNMFGVGAGVRIKL